MQNRNLVRPSKRKEFSMGTHWLILLDIFLFFSFQHMPKTHFPQSFSIVFPSIKQGVGCRSESTHFFEDFCFQNLCNSHPMRDSWLLFLFFYLFLLFLQFCKSCTEGYWFKSSLESWILSFVSLGSCKLVVRSWACLLPAASPTTWCILFSSIISMSWLHFVGSGQLKLWLS